MQQNNPHYWNQRLAQEGLSIWAGWNRHIVEYSPILESDDRRVDDDDDYPATSRFSVSSHPRGFVPRGARGAHTNTGALYSLLYRSLSEEDQKLLTMFSSMTSNAVAEQLGMSAATVRKRVQRIKQEIARQIVVLS